MQQPAYLEFDEDGPDPDQAPTRPTLGALFAGRAQDAGSGSFEFPPPSDRPPPLLSSDMVQSQGNAGEKW